MGPNYDVLRTFQSDASLEEKIRKLTALGFLSRGYTPAKLMKSGYREMVTEFKGSSQLEARLRGEPVKMILPVKPSPKLIPVATNRTVQAVKAVEPVPEKVAVPVPKAVSPVCPSLPDEPIPSRSLAGIPLIIAVAVVLCAAGIIGVLFAIRRKS